MALVSFPFILFVASTVLIYFLTPKKYQWIVLLIASYIFYWLNSKWLLFVMLASTLVTFLTGLGIDAVTSRGQKYLKERRESLSRQERKALKESTKKKAKAVLLIGVFIDLGLLLFLKYFNFFASSVSDLFSLAGADIHPPVLHLLLPLGISFYTLQAIAYMTDLYRGKCQVDRNLGKFMLFMSFFPQIVQGPIPRHNQLAHQLYVGHSFDYKRFTFGIQLMLWGWMKKLIIADRIAIPVNQIFDNHAQYTGLMAFLGAAFYGLQVYADFSGGMDIARGVAQILGIELELNFRQPYFSKSIEEFWRRWHITLGSWMRDYVFYPLSLSKGFAELSRKSRKILGPFIGKRLPSFLAMFIVYFLVGFWHGSSWKYIAYGIWNGIFIVAGILLGEVYDGMRARCGIGADTVTWRMFQMVRTFVLCSMGRFFSRADRLKDAWAMIVSVFKNWWDLSCLVDGSLLNLGLDTANWFLLMMAVLVLFFVDFVHERDVSIRETIARQGLVFRWAIYITAVLCVLIFGIYGPMYDAASFIYGQF